MSRAATDWAWSLNLKASQKLLLLSLADRADEYHCCYPSIMRLVNDTGLDRKTIGKWINQMIEEGLLSDTGERKGPTKRVRVLKLNLDFKCAQKREGSVKGNGPKNGNVPKIGPVSIKSPNDPKNGLLNDPKFGILNDPKNGTQNQSLEPNIEPINKTPAAKAAVMAAPGKTNYSPVFEEAWQAYPKRAGGNPKLSAWKAWSARLREGVRPEDMLAGVKRYANYARATGSAGTQYVKHAVTFFGPDRHFDENWEKTCVSHVTGSKEPGMYIAISEPDRTIPPGFTGYLS